jgi:hypothetical protein
VEHPQDTGPQRLPGDVLGFLLDALTIALSEDMPPGRRELVYTTSEVIRELVAAKHLATVNSVVPAAAGTTRHWRNSARPNACDRRWRGRTRWRAR